MKFPIRRALLVCFLPLCACGKGESTRPKGAAPDDAVSLVRRICLTAGETEPASDVGLEALVEDAEHAQALARAVEATTLASECERSLAVGALARRADLESRWVVEVLTSAFITRAESWAVVKAARARPAVAERVALQMLSSPSSELRELERILELAVNLRTPFAELSSALLRVPRTRLPGSSGLAAQRILYRWQEVAPEGARRASGTVLREMGPGEASLAVGLLLADRGGRGLLDWCRDDFAAIRAEWQAVLLDLVLQDDTLIELFQDWAIDAARGNQSRTVAELLARIAQGPRDHQRPR